jgi:hypothetical protein
MPGDKTRRDTECRATLAHEANTEWWAGAPLVPPYVGVAGWDRVHPFVYVR